MVSVGRYVLGAVAVVLLAASLGYGAFALRRRWLPHWDGAPARLAESVIGLAALILILEALGAIGLFRLGPVLGASLLFAGVGLAAGGGPGSDLRAPAGARWLDARAVRVSEPPLSNPVTTGLALLAAAAVTAQWASPALNSYQYGIRGFDSLWYHLPWAASFAQTGHITPLRLTDVEYLTAFYPATAEMLHGLGIALLGRDTLSPLLNIVWLWLALLAGWCIGRPRGCAPATLLGTALALATPALVASQAGSAANDVVGVCFLLAAAALISTDSDEPAALALAGVAAGLAVGVKLSLLGPVLALTIGAIVIAPAGRRAAAALLWLGSLLVAGGFWYARNLFVVGNPLPWTSLGGILPTPRPPLQQHTGFSIVHYLTDTHIWSAFFKPGLAAGLGPWWIAILIVAALGPALCLLPGASPTVRTLGLVALASTLAYLLTPESAAGPAGDPLGFTFNFRYAAPALTMSLAVVPLAPVLDGEPQQLATVLALAAMMFATLAQARFWPQHYVVIAVAFAAAALVVGLIISALGRLRPGFGLAIAAILTVAAAVAGYAGERHYLRGRYSFTPGFNYLGRTWAAFRGVDNARVAVAGTFGGFFSYPLYGLTASNHVQYIALQGPRGSFTPLTTCRAFRVAVNAGHYRYLVTTPSRDPWDPLVLGPSPERRWTVSDPAAHLIFSQKAQQQSIDIFQLSGPLNPAGCPSAGG